MEKLPRELLQTEDENNGQCPAIQIEFPISKEKIVVLNSLLLVIQNNKSNVRG